MGRVEVDKGARALLLPRTGLFGEGRREKELGEVGRAQGSRRLKEGGGGRGRLSPSKDETLMNTI